MSRHRRNYRKRALIYRKHSRELPDVGNRNSHTTVVAPTTTTHRGYPFEVLVTADESDFEEDSSVRLDQIRSVDIPERIQFVAGGLSASTMREIESALKLELDLD